MNLKKALIVSLLALSFCITPTAPSLASTNNIEVFVQTLDTDTVNIFYNNARGGYLYQLYLGYDTNNILTSGTFNSDSGQITLKKSAYPSLSTARNGERLTLRVIDPQNLRVISEKSVSLQAPPKAPTAMRVLNANLFSDRQNQNLEIAFDKAYVPSGKDRLNFYPLDNSGNIIQTGQRQVFEIYRGDLVQKGNDQVAVLNISVPRDVKAYKIVFTSGSEELSSLTQKLTIGETIKEVKRLIIDFPSTAVGLGDTIKVRVLAEDSYGNRNDITRQADLTFYGNPIRTRDYFNQSFTVYDNSRYLNDTIRITARYKGVTQEQNVKVVKDKVHDTGTTSTNSSSLRYTLNFKSTDLHTGKNYVQFQLRDEKGQNKALTFVPNDVLVSLVDTGTSKPISISATLFESAKITSTGEGTLELNVSEAVTGRVVAIFRGANPSQIYTANSQPLKFTGNATTLPQLPSPSNPNGSKSVILFMTAKSLIVDGSQKETQNLPSVVNGRTYVPLRTVAEAFGAKVTWDQKTKTATAVLGDTNVSMTIGQKSYTKNSIPTTMDAASYVDKKTNSTMVPVRYMAEAFGYKLNYNKIQINFTK